MSAFAVHDEQMLPGLVWRCLVIALKLLVSFLRCMAGQSRLLAVLFRSVPIEWTRPVAAEPAAPYGGAAHLHCGGGAAIPSQARHGYGNLH